MGNITVTLQKYEQRTDGRGDKWPMWQKDTILMVVASIFQHCRPCWRDPVWILLQRERPVDRSHQPVVVLLRAIVIRGGVLVLASVLKEQAVAGVELVINGEATPPPGQTPTFGLRKFIVD